MIFNILDAKEDRVQFFLSVLNASLFAKLSYISDKKKYFTRLNAHFVIIKYFYEIFFVRQIHIHGFD